MQAFNFILFLGFFVEHSTVHKLQCRLQTYYLNSSLYFQPVSCFCASNSVLLSFCFNFLFCLYPYHMLVIQKIFCINLKSFFVILGGCLALRYFLLNPIFTAYDHLRCLMTWGCVSLHVFLYCSSMSVEFHGHQLDLICWHILDTIYKYTIYNLWFQT